VDPQIAQYSQHVSIAFMQYSEYANAAAEFERKVRAGQMFQPLTEEDIINDSEHLDAARHTQHRVQELWREIWTQLDDAREIAQRMGRDTANYDRARALSRKHGAGASLDVGPWTHSSGRVYTRSVQHQVGSPELIMDAMAALLATVPEAEPPKVLKNEEIPDLGSSKLGLRVIVGIGIALVIAFVIAWIKIKH